MQPDIDKLFRDFDQVDIPADYETLLDRVFASMSNSDVVCLEGPSRALQKELEQFQVPLGEDSVPRGTSWPHLFLLGLYFDDTVANALSKAVRTLAAPEVCSHLFVRRKGQLVVAWYDFPEGPFLLDRRHFSLAEN